MAAAPSCQAGSLLCLPEEDRSQGFALSSTAGRVKESQYLPSGKGQQDSGGGREGSVGDPMLASYGLRIVNNPLCVWVHPELVWSGLAHTSSWQPFPPNMFPLL